MRTWNFKISDFPFFISFLKQPYRFFENYVSFFNAMTGNKQWTLWIEQGLEILNFQTLNSSVKLQCKSCPALASTLLPYPSLHCFAQPTLPDLALLCYTYLVISTHLIHNLLKYGTEMWKFSQFCSIFWYIFFTPSATLSFTPSFFWNEMCWGVHMSCKFHLYSSDL